MLIVGEAEAENKQVAVRKQGHGDLGVMSVEAFADVINREIDALLNQD
jgi:threonyl-tRNA synthetase